MPVQEGRDPVDRSVPEPLAHVEAVPQVQLLGRIDTSTDFSGHPRTGAHYIGDLGNPLGNGRGVLAGIILVTEVSGRSTRRGCKVQLHTLGRVVDGQLAEDFALEIAYFMMYPSSTARCNLMGRIYSGVA